MVPFLLAAVASDGSVTFDSNAPAATDFWIGPQRYGAAKVFGTEDAVEGTDTRANGLRYTSEGVLRVYDATSAVPAGSTIIGGFAVTSDGQLCVSTDSVASATFVGGIAVRSDGAVFATGLSTPRSIADAIITALSPAAWYRNATDVISSGGFASIWADYASSDKGLVLPGVNGNGATSPDSVPLSVTGDISILVRVRLNDYTPASAQALVHKNQTAGQNSYAFVVNSTFPGRLSFFYSPDGTVLREAISSANNGVTDGDATWLKVTYNSTTGKVNFSKAADSTSIPSSWTAIGTEQTLTAGAIFDGNTALGVGATGAGLIPSTGIFYRAIIYSDLTETTKVFDADFSSQTIGAGSFTESSSNAATVTINTSGAYPAHIGKARDLLQGTGTNQPAYAAEILTCDGSDQFMRTGALSIAKPISAYLVVRQDAWTSSECLIDGHTANIMRIYQSGSGGSPNLRLYGNGPAELNAAGLAGAAIGSFAIVCGVFDPSTCSLRVNDGSAITGDADDGTTVTAITLGAYGSGGAFYVAASYKEVVLFQALHDTTTQSSVITALNDLFTAF